MDLATPYVRIRFVCDVRQERSYEKVKLVDIRWVFALVKVLSNVRPFWFVENVCGVFENVVEVVEVSLKDVGLKVFVQGLKFVRYIVVVSAVSYFVVLDVVPLHRVVGDSWYFDGVNGCFPVSGFPFLYHGISCGFLFGIVPILRIVVEDAWVVPRLPELQTFQ